MNPAVGVVLLVVVFVLPSELLWGIDHGSLMVLDGMKILKNGCLLL